MKSKWRIEKTVTDGRVFYPRIPLEKSPDVDTRMLPVGRVSVDNVSFGDLVREFAGEMRSISSHYPLDYIEAIQNISLINPDVAQMVDNIVQLGNTGHKVVIESKANQDLAIEEINIINSQLFSRYGGVDGFVNMALAQIARGGAISVEWIVNANLNGLESVVFVPIKDIRFHYDYVTECYLPVQKTSDLSKGNNGVIVLNPFTYLYRAIQSVDNSPYAIPPILAALESIIIQRDIVKNLKFISKKMGLLGFVNFLIKAPKQIPGETTDDYINRCQSFLDDQAERLKYNYRDGIAVGFMDSFNVEHHSITGGAQGAKELFEMNEQQVFSGLKADPALHGRSYSTTETYASVVYEKMLSMLTNYQRVVKNVLEYGYSLHLKLAGIDVDDLWIEFDPSKSLSAAREEQTYSQKIDNLKKLYDQGIINQSQFASEIGYGSPALSAPRANIMGTPSTTEEQTKNNASVVKLNRCSQKYEAITTKQSESFQISDNLYHQSYWLLKKNISNHRECHHHGRNYLTSDKFNEKLFNFEEEYFLSVYPEISKSRNKAIELVRQYLDQFDFETGDSDLFASGVLETMGLGFAQGLENSKLNKKVSESLAIMYSYFRLEDATPFAGKFPIKPSFTLIDEKAIEFLKKSDNFYFGRYLTNPQTKTSLRKWLVEEYLSSGRSLRDSGELKKFKQKFTDKVIQQDFQILRIVETTTNRSRNWGNIFSVEQAGGASIEITGPLDNITCDWCLAMTGKIFKVSPVVQHIKSIMDRDPESLPDLNPFLPGTMNPKIADALSEDQLLARGIALPPYHPHCRHTFVINELISF